MDGIQTYLREFDWLKLAAIMLFALPGFISLRVWALIFPTSERPLKDEIGEAISFGHFECDRLRSCLRDACAIQCSGALCSCNSDSLNFTCNLANNITLGASLARRCGIDPDFIAECLG